jgi:hypothetical protein
VFAATLKLAYFYQRSEDMKKMLTSTYPVAGVDFAKLIFWSFLAGFFERLVPQIISKTSTTSKKDE